jgi:hypothetical protein
MPFSVTLKPPVLGPFAFKTRVKTGASNEKTDTKVPIERETVSATELAAESPDCP